MSASIRGFVFFVALMVFHYGLEYGTWVSGSLAGAGATVAFWMTQRSCAEDEQ